jgi:hypothetical protein
VISNQEAKVGVREAGHWAYTGFISVVCGLNTIRSEKRGWKKGGKIIF